MIGQKSEELKMSTRSIYSERLAPGELSSGSLLEKLLWPGIPPVSRRKALQYFLGGTTTVVLSSISKQAQSNPLLRVFVQVIAVGVLSFVKGYAEEAGKDYYHRESGKVLNPEVLALAKEASATIWVKGNPSWVQSNGYNRVKLTFTNLTNRPLLSPIRFYLSLRDTESGQEELRTNFGILTFEGQKAEFSIPDKYFCDLPYPGVKRVFAYTHSMDIHCEPTNNILVTEYNKLFV